MGIKPSEARAVASCHLHIDHSGNNYRFPVTPIFVQRAERDAASTTLDYSLPDTIAFREARGCSFNETSDDARARALLAWSSIPGASPSRTTCRSGNAGPDIAAPAPTASRSPRRRRADP